MNAFCKACDDFEETLQSLLKTLAAEEGFFAGSLYVSRVKCGKISCRCMNSEYRHESVCLSFKEDGKSRTRTVPSDIAETVKAMTGNYREIRALRRRLLHLSRSLIKAVDAETGRCIKAGEGVLLRALNETKEAAHD